jgi:hypothetical protein
VLAKQVLSQPELQSYTPTYSWRIFLDWHQIPVSRTGPLLFIGGMRRQMRSLAVVTQEGYGTPVVGFPPANSV